MPFSTSSKSVISSIILQFLHPHTVEFEGFDASFFRGFRDQICTTHGPRHKSATFNYLLHNADHRSWSHLSTFGPGFLSNLGKLTFEELRPKWSNFHNRRLHDGIHVVTLVLYETSMAS